MRQIFRFVLLSALLSTMAFADIQLNVFGSLAPNRWGSYSYDGYAVNALTALENNAATAGDPSKPTAYSQVSQIDPRQNVVTGFPSWLGDASPQGAFAAELGNRLTFGLYVDGGGAQFDAHDITFNMTSTDPGNVFGYTEAVTDFIPGSGTFSTKVLYGDTGDGTWVQITDPLALYKRLVFVGMGNAPDAYTDGLTNQQQIDAAVASIPTPYSITGTYTLTLPSHDPVRGSATVDVAPVPEPTSLALMGTIVAGLWALRRKRFV